MFPEDPSKPDSLLAFFDLGNFTIQSDLSKKDSSSYRETDMYDRYKVSLSSIKALLTRNDLDWRNNKV